MGPEMLEFANRHEIEAPMDAVGDRDVTGVPCALRSVAFVNRER